MTDESTHGSESQPKRNRWLVQTIGIVVSVAAAAISAFSAVSSYDSYQSQQNTSTMAMANQVVIVAPPMSADQFDRIKKQHPVNTAEYAPIYVLNYGRLPVLGLVIQAHINYVNGTTAVQSSSEIGTLLPCTEVEADGVLRAAIAKSDSRELRGWYVTVRFQDVSGQYWQRGLIGPPVPEKGNDVVLQDIGGITTKHVDDCTAA